MLADEFPHLLDEWDYQKNDRLPQEITRGSNYRAWWKCEHNHFWLNSVFNRTSSPNATCPTCKSFGFKQPELAQEFSEKNDKSIFDVAEQSNKMFIWNCSVCGGDYKRSPCTKIKSPQCPYCTGQKVLAGFNDLSTVSTDVLAFWDYEKNTNITPQELSARTNRLVWWKCQNNHSYILKVRDFVAKIDKCAYCAKRRTDVSEDNLSFLYPEINRIWSAKNLKQPEELSRGAQFKALLICEKGHEFSRNVNKIVNRGYDCPVCNDSKLLSGYNDLKTAFPHIVENYWDYEKNVILPEQVKKNSTLDYYWICDEGHSVKRNCRHLYNGFHCTDCSRSSLEFQVLEFMKTIIEEEIMTNVRKVIGLELDLFIPKMRKAIECNGDYWHSEKILQEAGKECAKNYHMSKHNSCSEKDIDLIFIWEYDWKNNQELVKDNLVLWLNDEEYDKQLFNKLESVVDTPDLYS